MIIEDKKIVAFTRVKCCGIADNILHMAELITGTKQSDCRLFCRFVRNNEFVKKGECLSYDFSLPILD